MFLYIGNHKQLVLFTLINYGSPNSLFGQYSYLLINPILVLKIYRLTQLEHVKSSNYPYFKNCVTRGWISSIGIRWHNRTSLVIEAVMYLVRNDPVGLE